MTRSRLGVLSICAMVVGMMAISSASAQAADWLVLDASGTVTTLIALVNGTVNLLVALTGSKEGLNLTLLTHLVGLKVGVSCTAFTTSNIHLAPAGKLTEGGKLVFTGCTVSEGDTHCTVKSPGAATGTVESAEGKGELVLHELAGGGKEVLTKLEAKSEEVGFATLRFEGECSLPESNVVKGVIYLKDCEGKATVFLIEHLVEQGPLTKLTVGKDTAEHLETSIDGSVWARLAGEHANLKWAAMFP